MNFERPARFSASEPLSFSLSFSPLSPLAPTFFAGLPSSAFAPPGPSTIAAPTSGSPNANSATLRNPALVRALILAHATTYFDDPARSRARGDGHPPGGRRLRRDGSRRGQHALLPRPRRLPRQGRPRAGPRRRLRHRADPDPPLREGRGGGGRRDRSVGRDARDRAHE